MKPTTTITDYTGKPIEVCRRPESIKCPELRLLVATLLASGDAGGFALITGENTGTVCSVDLWMRYGAQGRHEPIHLVSRMSGATRRTIRWHDFKRDQLIGTTGTDGAEKLRQLYAKPPTSRSTQ